MGKLIYATRVRAFYCDHFVLPLPEGHRFPMAKYRQLREHVLAEAIIAPGDLREPAAAEWDQLRLVHTEAYLSGVACGTLPRDIQRRIGFPWSLAMVERARRSVGGTIAASRVALDEGSAANLAGGTHHAFADRGEGFCVFNDIAVAVRVLVRERRIARALIVDLDVHQGNGTAAIFAHDPAVFTFSMHGASNFPSHKEISDSDIALPDGTQDAEYLDILAKHVPALVERHRPDLVFYLAGADPYEADRLGKLKLTVEGLRARDALVFAACRDADVPDAVSMGGGYALDIDAIVRIHANTLREAHAAVRECSFHQLRS